MLKRKYKVPWDRPLTDIFYKSTYWKVLSFIATEESGTTKAGTTYLYNYPHQFANVFVHPVACPLVISKFFGYVNGFESHNKFKKSDLELKK